MKWIILLSGGPADNPWDDTVVTEAPTIPEALQSVSAPGWQIDGVVRADIWEDLNREE